MPAAMMPARSPDRHRAARHVPDGDTTRHGPSSGGGGAYTGCAEIDVDGYARYCRAREHRPADEKRASHRSLLYLFICSHLCGLFVVLRRLYRTRRIASVRSGNVLCTVEKITNGKRHHTQFGKSCPFVSGASGITARPMMKATAVSAMGIPSVFIWQYHRADAEVNDGPEKASARPMCRTQTPSLLRAFRTARAITAKTARNCRRKNRERQAAR